MRYLLLFVSLICICASSACSDEPIAGTPNNQTDMSMDGGDTDMDTNTDTDMNTDMEEPHVAPTQRLVIQPVSGSGTVKSAKFKAHLQIGRSIDATSK